MSIDQNIFLNRLSKLQEQTLEESCLYVVPTPLGNLADISLRAISIFSKVDIILCEDTRNTLSLLNSFGIKNKLMSNHKFNEERRIDELIALLKDGKILALCSDAGMPCIADPGETLVKACHFHDIKIRVLPGANAALSALVWSGFPSSHFSFYGFLPRKQKDCIRVLTSCLKNMCVNKQTYIFYESPHRLLKTLSLMKTLNLSDQKLAIIKEISKIHEDCAIKSVDEHYRYYSENEAKGEYVLVLHLDETYIKNLSEENLEDDNFTTYDNDEQIILKIKEYLLAGKSAKSICLILAETYHRKKNELYSLILEIKTDMEK